MGRDILLSVVCLVLPYPSILSHKRRDFQKKKVVELKMRVLISCTNFTLKKILILRRTERDVIINVSRYSCKIFEKCSDIKFPSSGSRIVPCGRTDRQTDKERHVTNLIIAPIICPNAVKNVTQECETHPRSFDIQASFLTFPP